MVWSQPRQIVCKTLSQKKNHKKSSGVAQGEDPEFKSQKTKQNKTKQNKTLTYL
jgi:hypothetical protein